MRGPAAMGALQPHYIPPVYWPDILRYLASVTEPVRLKDICDATGHSRYRVASTLDRLERRGDVERWKLPQFSLKCKGWGIPATHMTYVCRITGQGRERIMAEDAGR